MRTKFYAVVSGREPGIYTDWSTCESMVKGYPGAIFKSFPTKAAAESFINNSKHEVSSIVSSNVVHSTVPLVDKVKIYTDGSSDGVSKGGYGVVAVLPNGDKITACGVVPLKATSDVAELYAVYVALSLISSDVVIYSDCTYVVNTFTTWLHSDNPKRANINLIQSISKLLVNRKVEFYHVKAHCGHELNEEADNLANQGANSGVHMILKKNGVVQSQK